MPILLLAGAFSGTALAVTLDEAVAAAREHDVDLHLVHEQTVQAESYRGQAWSALAPKVTAGASYTINSQEIALDPTAGLPPELAGLVGDVQPIVIQQKDYWAWNANIIQPLFDGSSVPLLRGAYKLTNAARLSEKSADQQIREGVARAYYGVLTAREGEKLADKAVETAKEGEESARSTSAAGLTPERATLQAELQRSQAERDARNATAARVEAEQAFVRITGLPADTPVELPPPPEVPDDVERAVELARVQRPDLLAARTQAEVARMSRDANWIGWVPDVDGRFTYSWSQNTGFSGKNGLWMVVFEGNWVLWDGGFRFAKAAEEASKVRMADYAAQKQEESAVEEVRVAYEKYARAQSAVDAVAHEVALAEENLRQAQAGFAAGTLTYLELQAAELQENSSKVNELVERMNRDLAGMEVQRATGTL